VTARHVGILAALLAAAAVAARLLKGGQDDAEPAATSAAEPPPAAAASATVQGYCVKERKKVEIVDPQAVKTKNGRDAVRGKCPDCGASIFRMGKLPGG
jgi:Domain of unknown function (DUF5679)